MAVTSKVVLILGSGANVGQHVAKVFAAQGYKVASVSRSGKDGETPTEGMKITADFSRPESIAEVFSKVKNTLGIPSVVVYNASSTTRVDPKNPLSVPLADFSRSLSINTLSAYAAMEQAAHGFAQLPSTASRTFIYTGNLLNTGIIPALLDLGTGKSATAHIIKVAATAYKDQGFKFYYADEREADGTPLYNGVNGDAHAEFYSELAEEKDQRDWLQTFVKGEGYKKF